MNLKIHKINQNTIVELISDQQIINDVQDSLDLMADAGEYDSDKIIIYERNLSPDFFRLSTGIASEILQKFSTYTKQLAIIGDYAKFSSKSLKDFIYESNKTGRILFITSLEEALEKLSRN